MATRLCCCTCSAVTPISGHASEQSPLKCWQCHHELSTCMRCIKLTSAPRASPEHGRGSATTTATTTTTTTKASWRREVSQALRAFAVPDSRFDHDYTRFIPDFGGSDAAIARLRQRPEYRDAATVFVTPDNCLGQLRRLALCDGRDLLVSTYGIRRGFRLLSPKKGNPANDPDYDLKYNCACAVGPADFDCVVELDRLERVGEPVSLTQIRDRRLVVDLAITGAGAVDARGLRLGKGHGFFDLEWAMLYSVGAVRTRAAGAGGRDAGRGYAGITPVVALVHDCQVVGGELLCVEPEFDVACDLVVTPSGTQFCGWRAQPACGIIWDRLKPGMLESIPPLRELRDMIRSHC